MKCKHCSKPIVLMPSAKERARVHGGMADDYTKLFEYHAACTLELRAKGVSELMQRIKRKGVSA